MFRVGATFWSCARSWTRVFVCSCSCSVVPGFLCLLERGLSWKPQSARIPKTSCIRRCERDGESDGMWERERARARRGGHRMLSRGLCFCFWCLPKIEPPATPSPTKSTHPPTPAQKQQHHHHTTNTKTNTNTVTQPALCEHVSVCVGLVYSIA